LSIAEKIDVPATSSGFVYYQRIIMNLWGDPSVRLRFDPSTSIEDRTSESLSTFTLLQNHPNPFNSSTKISWQSPISGWQTLKVFDVLGREVATLVNEEKEAGYHSVDFNASDLPSGVYFYRIQAGNFIDTKKMILLK